MRIRRRGRKADVGKDDIELEVQSDFYKVIRTVALPPLPL